MGSLIDPTLAVVPRNLPGDLTWLALLLAAAWGYGSAFFAKETRTPLTQAFAATLGLAVLSALGMAAGLLGHFTFSWTLALWAPGCALALWRVLGIAFSRPKPPSWSLWFFLGLALVTLLYAYSPPVGDDSEYIYLAMPRLYALKHALVEVPQNAHAYFPSAIEMLYTQLMLVGTPLAPRLLNWLFGLLAAFWTGALAQEGFGVSADEAMLAFYAMPWVVSLSGSGKVDLGGMAFALAATAAFLLWRKNGGTGMLILAALLAGAQNASKLTGPIVAISIALVILFDGWRAPQSSKALGNAGLFLLVSTAVAAPWYVRSYLLTGNPLYPGRFLGLPFDVYLDNYYRLARLPFTSPWNVLTRGFDGIVYWDIIWGTGPWLWAFLPAALCAATPPAGKRLIALSVLQIFGTCLAFHDVAGTRFIGPALACLVPASLWGVRRLCESDARGLRRDLLVALALVPGGALAAYFGAKRIPMILGLQSQGSFLESKWTRPEDYDAMLYIWASSPVEEGVFFTFPSVAPGFYYPNRKTAAVAAYPQDFYSRETPERAFAQLKADGYRLLIVCPGEYTTNAAGHWTLSQFAVTFTWMNPDTLTRYCDIVFKGPRSTVYRIR